MRALQPPAARGRRQAAVLTTALVALATMTAYACRSTDSVSVSADPRVVLGAHISHGIGDSPFDSPLVQDSLAAEMIVRARDCVPTSSLRNLTPNVAEGGRLLERLQADGLVAVRDGRACTPFPILIHRDQARYAELTDSIAAGAFRDLSSDWAAIMRLIRERGWNDWQYHFAWSQLFDSQVAWTEMMTRGLVPPIEHLIVWVVFPDHRFRSGTNYYPDTELRDHWLMVTWRAGAANTSGPVGGSWDPILRAGVEGGALTEEETRRLTDLGVLDRTGQLQWPVLRRGDSLHNLLQDVARRYVDLLEEGMPLERLVGLSGVDTRRTFAMAYHDVSWGILERLVRSGQIEIPPALVRGASNARPSMHGVASLTPVYAPFVDLIRAALERRE